FSWHPAWFQGAGCQLKARWHDRSGWHDKNKASIIRALHRWSQAMVHLIYLEKTHEHTEIRTGS
ncbi:MAG TPA: hypothetical protein VLJ15_08075, partial [Gammaproteobacteria bacterium]|nr:hypothetical protein [Gammaproteobacteria bacterium]